jgi:NADH:ubiquinone oxidoreductase subunit E/NAD-dependent dihydropyrimidine dehydrogenase PreA subunit
LHPYAERDEVSMSNETLNIQLASTKGMSVGSVLVVGAGIGGMQAALDLAESGFKVYLLDSAPAIGGTMTQLDKTFPTNECAMCIMAPKLVECARHRNIELLANADLEKIQGEAGRFTAHITKKVRYVDEEKCTGCGDCMSHCPVRNQIYVLPPTDPTPIDLSAEDRGKIEGILHEHDGQKRALVSILQGVSALYNYLPEGALRYLSRELDVPLSLIYRIATFYTAFSLTPRGKHIINVCVGTTCHVKGAPLILDTLGRELGINTGETTDDKIFTLEEVACLGCCGLAPVMTVGDELYPKVNQADVSKILRKYR